ncbi:MAG: condensation domain-containing protein [Bacteroidota bacterium]
MGEVLISQKLLYLRELFSNEPPPMSADILKVVGKVDWPRLEKSFRKLILNHESLRTSYYFKTPGVFDRVEKPGDFKIQHHKIDDSELLRFLKNERKPFNLKNTPLIKAFRVDTSSDEYLVIQLPHINSDGWSIQVILKHLTEYYRDLHISIPGISQFESFKKAYTTYLNSRTFKRDKNYWDRQSSELTSVQWPNENQTATPSQFQNILPDELYNKLKNQDGENSFFLMTLTAVLLLLHKVNNIGKSQIMFAIHNRTFELFNPGENFENTIGLIVNRLIISLPVKEYIPLKQFIANVKMKVLEVMRHHRYPFEHFVGNVNVTDRKKITPYYFNYFEYAEDSMLGDDATLIKERIHKDDEILPLIFEIGKIGDKLAALVASNGTYDEASCERFLKSFTDILCFMVDRPDMDVQQLLTSIDISSKKHMVN